MQDRFFRRPLTSPDLLIFYWNANNIRKSTVFGYPPPSEDSDSTHVCGNERCIAAAHLRWQSQGENRDDQRFHKMHAPLTPRSQTTSMRRFSRMPWPE